MTNASAHHNLIPIGGWGEFAKTISESNICLVRITRDFRPNHVNAESMTTTPCSGIIAHGVLSVGLLPTGANEVLDYAPSSTCCVAWLRPDPLHQAGARPRHYGGDE